MPLAWARQGTLMTQTMTVSWPRQGSSVQILGTHTHTHTPALWTQYMAPRSDWPWLPVTSGFGGQNTAADRQSSGSLEWVGGLSPQYVVFMHWSSSCHAEPGTVSLLGNRCPMMPWQVPRDIPGHQDVQFRNLCCWAFGVLLLKKLSGLDCWKGTAKHFLATCCGDTVGKTKSFLCMWSAHLMPSRTGKSAG